MKTTTIHIKNMVCSCCLRVIREEFEKAGIIVEEIRLGQATISYDPATQSLEDVRAVLLELGTDLIDTRESRLVEEVKRTVFELIHQMNNVDSI